MDNRLYLKTILTAAFAYIAGYVLSLFEAYIFSGIMIISAGLINAFRYLKKSGKLTEPAAYFSLSWLCGSGVSALKLSRLQTEWSAVSWICFFFIYLFFILGYSAVKKRIGKTAGTRRSEEYADIRTDAECMKIPVSENTVSADKYENDGLLAALNIVFILSYIAFFTEALVLGYIPLFTENTPHAYSYFHVSGLHYFTVSCVLVPSLAVIWFIQRKQIAAKYSRITDRLMCLDVLLCTVLSVLLPVLLVSRFQLIFSVLLAGMTYLCMKNGVLPFKINLKKVLACAASFSALLLIYVFITYERAHSIEYLNGIFEMKYNLPIFISQPYIYIANNFDNFNCMTRLLTKHTYGLKMLFPLFALTGMKFTHPELVSFPLFVTKEELTTVTLFYDAYYDFGIAGISVFALILGIIIAYLTEITDTDGKRHPISAFIFAQLDFYILFAFFTTWFSNPSTWFYLTAAISIGIFIKLYTYFFSRHFAYHDKEERK